MCQTSEIAAIYIEDPRIKNITAVIDVRDVYDVLNTHIHLL